MNSPGGHSNLARPQAPSSPVLCIKVWKPTLADHFVQSYAGLLLGLQAGVGILCAVGMQPRSLRRPSPITAGILAGTVISFLVNTRISSALSHRVPDFADAFYTLLAVVLCTTLSNIAVFIIFVSSRVTWSADGHLRSR